MPTATAVLPPPTGVMANYFGQAGGSTTRYYWVQAIYPGGYSNLARSASVTTVATLDLNNRVQISWNPAPGAIAYNVYYTTTTTQPSRTATLVASNVTGNSVSDIGTTESTTATVKFPGLKFARAIYDFATDGGAVSTLTPVDTEEIPAGALVVGGCVRVSDAFLSGGSATLAVGTSAGSSSTSILGATAKASLTANAVIVSAANGTPFRMSAAGSINFTIGTATATAGQVEAYVWYINPTTP